MPYNNTVKNTTLKPLKESEITITVNRDNKKQTRSSGKHSKFIKILENTLNIIRTNTHQPEIKTLPIDNS